jgi:hypothetical protein
MSRRREPDYFRWNREAFCLLAFQLSWFVHMGLLPTFASFRVGVALILAHAAAMTVWTLWYFYRAGEARRRRLEFLKYWGPPCRICGAQGEQPCDAGLHG